MFRYKFRHAAAIIAVSAISALSFEADAQRGEKVIGIQAGYNSHNESAVAGVFFSYRFSQHFRVAPSAQYVFRNKHTDAFLLNCDLQVPFSFGLKRVELYPMAGLCFASWNTHSLMKSVTHTDDVSSRTDRFGLNIGAGMSVKCTSTLRLNFDVRYSVIDDYNTTMATVGIGYCF